MENSSNNTIDLRRLFNLCRKHLKFLITCTIALALAGFIVSKFVKGGFELSFYGGLKMHDLGGLRINRC